MKNNDGKDSPSVEEVIQRYAPGSGDRAGIAGALLEIIARAAGIAPKFSQAAQTTQAPTPEVILSSRNAAGQMVMTSNAELAATFGRMEKVLQQGFDKASKPDASPADRQSFVTLAQQVQEDAAVLAAQCLITNPKGPAKYEFILQPNPGQHVPLAQAFAAVQKREAPAKGRVELIRFGTERPVIMMRPVNGFKSASRKQPTA
jgi:hypothetical protein